MLARCINEDEELQSMYLEVNIKKRGAAALPPPADSVARLPETIDDGPEDDAISTKVRRVTPQDNRKMPARRSAPEDEPASSRKRRAGSTTPSATARRKGSAGNQQEAQKFPTVLKLEENEMTPAMAHVLEKMVRLHRATKDDVKIRKTKKALLPIVEGQVAFECIGCSSKQIKDRERLCSRYPTSFSAAYTWIKLFINLHKCEFVQKNRSKYEGLKITRKRDGDLSNEKGIPTVLARHGLIERDRGLFWEPDNN